MGINPYVAVAAAAGLLGLLLGIGIGIDIDDTPVLQDFLPSPQISIIEKELDIRPDPFLSCSDPLGGIQPDDYGRVIHARFVLTNTGNIAGFAVVELTVGEEILESSRYLVRAGTSEPKSFSAAWTRCGAITPIAELRISLVEPLPLTLFTTTSSIIILVAVSVSTLEIIYRQLVTRPVLKIKNYDPHPYGGFVQHGFIVDNKGGKGAGLAEAKLTLDIKAEDVLDVDDAYIKSDAFVALKEQNIFWAKEKGPGHAVHIKAGGSELMIVARLAKKKKDDYGAGVTVPTHIQIPSEKGWDKMRVALKAKDYNGWIRVEAMNGKVPSKKFKIKYANGELKLEF